MKKGYRLFCVFLLISCFTPICFSETRLRMSTTTSTEDSGLLKVLLPPFEKANNVKVDVISVGTGKALKLGENGDVDVVFVHARAAEDKFVADGHGVDRRDVMYNDYIILGPKNDPARIKETTSAVDALKKIAETKSLFISRGDESGTDKKEKSIWRAAGIVPQTPWYIEAGQGMGAVLQMANEKNAYTIGDRGTFIPFENKIGLIVLVEGDKTLFNPYGVIAVNPKKYPGVQYELANKFVEFVVGPEGQKIIAEYKLDGKQLFFPDAKK